MSEMQTTTTDHLSPIFAALADPTRRAIVARLADGEATVTELAAPFDVSLPAISKHLKVLQRAGLVEQGRQAQWRPCRLKPEPLRDVATWLERYHEFLGERYDRLDAYLRELQDTQKESDDGSLRTG
jgi:DNA-binding transcriptional ArsR family regulator